MRNGTEPIRFPAIPLAVSQAFAVANGSRLSEALRIVNIIFCFMKLGASALLFAGTPGLRGNRFRTLDLVSICFYRDCMLSGSCRL